MLSDLDEHANARTVAKRVAVMSMINDGMPSSSSSMAQASTLEELRVRTADRLVR